MTTQPDGDFTEFDISVQQWSHLMQPEIPDQDGDVFSPGAIASLRIEVGMKVQLNFEGEPIGEVIAADERTATIRVKCGNKAMALALLGRVVSSKDRLVLAPSYVAVDHTPIVLAGITVGCRVERADLLGAGLIVNHEEKKGESA